MSHDHTAHALTSRQVSSSPVIEYAAALLADSSGLVDAGRIIPGTPAWAALDDADPRKIHALIAGGVREALENGVSIVELERSWQGDLDTYRQRIAPVLLYD